MNMNLKYKVMMKINPFISVLSAVTITTSAMSAPFVINSAGAKIEGTAIESSPDGTVSLTVKSGQVLTFRAGAYRQAHADKPPEFIRAEAFIKKGDFSPAAELLQKIKTNYKSLGWDQHAIRMLARVELARKDFPAAVREFEILFAQQPELKNAPADRTGYMQALLGAGRIQETAALADEDIASGSRAAAARAQIIRGDIKSAGGQVEEALLDYLRTAILFRDQLAALPEAFYKTAGALKKLHDPRAGEYFQKVIEEFPDSEFATLAKGELK